MSHVHFAFFELHDAYCVLRNFMARYFVTPLHSTQHGQLTTDDLPGPLAIQGPCGCVRAPCGSGPAAGWNSTCSSRCHAPPRWGSLLNRPGPASAPGLSPCRAIDHWFQILDYKYKIRWLLDLLIPKGKLSCSRNKDLKDKNLYKKADHKLVKLQYKGQTGAALN